jgi:hypothetical protein
VLTNQCDWAASVDCSLNSDPKMLSQHAGPSPRPLQQQKPFQQHQPFQQQEPFQQQFQLGQAQGQPQQQFQPQLPFSRFFRF